MGRWRSGPIKIKMKNDYHQKRFRYHDMYYRSISILMSRQKANEKENTTDSNTDEQKCVCVVANEHKKEFLYA